MECTTVHKNVEDDNLPDRSKNDEKDNQNMTEHSELKETNEKHNINLEEPSDCDIILRNAEPRDSRSKWNQKCTILTLISNDGDEEAYWKYEKNDSEIKTKKIPKVLSKLCLGPGTDDSVIGSKTEKSKIEDSEDDSYTKECKIQKSKSKTLKKMFRSKSSECSDQSNRSRSGSNESVENESKTEAKENEKHTKLSKNPKMLRRMFTMNQSNNCVENCSNYDEDNILRQNTEPQTCLDSEDDVELRKPSSLKNTISEGFRNSFRLKRTLSEPAPKKPRYTLKPRRSTTLRSISKVIFQFQVPALSLQPPAPLLVEDPPSTDDGSDLEDVRQNTDPALLNGAPNSGKIDPTTQDVRRQFLRSRKYHSVSCMGEPMMLCFVQGFDGGAKEGEMGKEPRLQVVRNKFLRKSRSSGNFGSAGTRSAPSTPQGVLCASPGGLVEPLSQPCSPGCTSPSIQRSPSHSLFTKCEKASLKHLSTSTPVMTAQAQLAEPPSPKATKDPKVHTTSKARQKKFLRHFPNVEDDEKVLNHYSCALIGDILLQGHLYITKNYFAFYSNVFGYVTKLLIPVLTVENITKEKTARIIPNAVGISTSEDKHVFGSLMSRDNTLQYMRTVWQKAKSASPVIIEPEITEQDLDSSESGDGESGRDSPPIEIKPRFSLVKNVGAGKDSLLPHATEAALSCERSFSKSLMKPLKQAISDFRKLPRQSLILFATTLLLILLFLSAAVLLYRISKIQNKYTMALQDHAVTGGSEDIYSDLLNWQTHLHSKSAGAVHNFLDSNLDQIAKVRQSLEALSSLLIQNEDSTGQESSDTPLEATEDAS